MTVCNLRGSDETHFAGKNIKGRPTDCSTIAIGPYRRLCESLGIDAAPYHIVDISQQIVIVDDRVADRLGADAKVVWHLPEQWRDDHAYDRTPVKYPARFRPITLANGDKVILDKDGQACLRMPDGGFYYDICNHPLEPVQDLKDLNEFAGAFENWYCKLQIIPNGMTCR